VQVDEVPGKIKSNQIKSPTPVCDVGMYDGENDYVCF
jgi:hypothetical protein